MKKCKDNLNSYFFCNFFKNVVFYMEVDTIWRKFVADLKYTFFDIKMISVV